jgi:uncharacterized protein YukE
MAGNVYGADVGELRGLSERMSRSAGELDRIVNLLTHQITATTAWVGPSAQRFRGDWAGSHRAAVASSARALRECAAALRRNAEDQDRTSAADSSSAPHSLGGNASGTGVGTGLGLSFMAAFAAASSRIVRLDDKVGGFGKLNSGLDFLSARKMVIGSYTSKWSSVLSWGDRHGLPADLLRFKRSPFTHLLQPFNGVLKAAGSAFTGLGVASGALQTSSALSQGHYVDGALQAASTAADVIKGKGGQAYLVGVAVQTWVEVGKAAQEADWSAQGFHQAQSASLGDWAYGFDYAMKKMPAKLVTIFSP